MEIYFGPASCKFSPQSTQPLTQDSAGAKYTGTVRPDIVIVTFCAFMHCSPLQSTVGKCMLIESESKDGKHNLIELFLENEQIR